jgi:hypothetical protein
MFFLAVSSFKWLAGGASAAVDLIKNHSWMLLMYTYAYTFMLCVCVCACVRLFFRVYYVCFEPRMEWMDRIDDSVR